MQDYLVSRRKEEGLRRWRGRKDSPIYSGGMNG